MPDLSLEAKEGHRNKGITVRATEMSKSDDEAVETDCYEGKQ